MLLRWVIYRMGQTNKQTPKNFMLRVPLSWSLSFSPGNCNDPSPFAPGNAEDPLYFHMVVPGPTFSPSVLLANSCFPLGLSLNMCPFPESPVHFLPTQLETMAAEIAIQYALYFSYTYQKYRFLLCGLSFLIDYKLYVNREFMFLVYHYISGT